MMDAVGKIESFAVEGAVQVAVALQMHRLVPEDKGGEVFVDRQIFAAKPAVFQFEIAFAKIKAKAALVRLQVDAAVDREARVVFFDLRPCVDFSFKLRQAAI